MKSDKEVFFEETFAQFDIGNKGELNLQESKNFINLMLKTFFKDKSGKKSTHLSEESLLQIIHKIDANGDGAHQKDEIMDAVDEIVFIILEKKS